MQRICIIRALRLDRVLFCASRFVRLNLGPQFADPPPFDLRAIFQSSNHRTPLIFVLSPGVDPTAQVKSLANDLSTNVDICALGQGQAPVAMSLMNLGLRSGSNGEWSRAFSLASSSMLVPGWLQNVEKARKA